MLPLALLQLDSANLSADSFRKLVPELHDSGVLIRSCVLLDVILNFLFKLIRADCSLGENYRCLYNLTSEISSGAAVTAHSRTYGSSIITLSISKGPIR